jgi:hypothetical protein
MPLRKRPVEQHLFKMIEYGGPLLYHGGEDQQRSFDSTCRKFRRFLTETAAWSSSITHRFPRRGVILSFACQRLVRTPPVTR